MPEAAVRKEIKHIEFFLVLHPKGNPYAEVWVARKGVKGNEALVEHIRDCKDLSDARAQAALARHRNAAIAFESTGALSED